ncbi:helix-turn-helix domain-containing protein [Desulfofundulus thermocisternus]|uniref:helix-turn-helix domain-containing protein n=1 Tax=Desulfofundulus thermocisternus TaxID=42471 RepID=UPI00217CD2E3|nr:helix-turn-helix transcriptional regulator [Desulfofundulus thermocisternus]MCS5696935.1 helix-turn-helix domain-containing protein [Desulfofundulus thermocisternus]
MRIGTVCKILRNSNNLPLRKFAKLTGLPHSSIAALESGWLTPTANTVTALLNYLSLNESEKFSCLAQYIGKCFLQEYALRLLADNPFFSVSQCSLEVLRAFLDSEYTLEDPFWQGDFVKYILPEELLPSERDSKRKVSFTVYSYLWSLISDDIFEYSALTTETKFKIIVWLAKDMRFLKPEEAYLDRLTQPTPRIEKFLNSLPPRVAWTFGHFIELIKQDPPNRVPDAIGALDVILLLCDRVELNPLNPGEITVYLTSHTKKQKKIECFYLPQTIIECLPGFHCLV